MAEEKKPAAPARKSREVDKLRPVEDMLCGAIAGCVSRMIVAPLDVLKIRFQVQSETGGRYAYRTVAGAFRSIIQNEGLRALWKGNVPALLMVVPYASVQFALFYQLDRSDVLPSASDFVRRLTFGGFAGAAATLASYPLDLVRTRMAAAPERANAGLRTSARAVMEAHGLRGFYLGIAPTVVQIVPYIALHYAAYEYGRDIVTRNRETTRLSTVESLSVGAVSGTVAKLLTLPLDNAKKRMQVTGQFAGAGPPYKNAVDAIVRIFQKEGMKGLFRGTVPNLLKAAPNSAITFAAYEASKKHLLKRSSQQREEE